METRPNQDPKNEWVEPEEIVIREFNSLRGRLCNVVESLGLPTRQEVAFKTLMKSITHQQEDIVKELIETLDERGARFRYREGRLIRE